MPTFLLKPFAASRRSAATLRLAFVVPPVLLFLAGAGMAARGGAPPKTPVGTVAHPPAPEQAAYERDIQPLLNEFCTGCHSGQNAQGGVNLATANVRDLQRDQATWRKALVQIQDRAMPPKAMPQPKDEQRERLATWLAHTLDNAPDSVFGNNPGRVVLHRLSRLEYNNTVRDLFGVTSRPADKFPADAGGGGGFDNNADTLFLPPVLLERYLQAATDVLDEARPERIFVARPSAKTPAGERVAARKILAHHATRAWRRPVEPAEVNRLVALFDRARARNATFEDAAKFALRAVLVSPHFLYRVERDRPGANGPYPISDYELATRLSYFLWATMPDDELFGLAVKKRLRDPQVLRAQVRRMLASPKSRALADSFAGQWLRVRSLYTVAQPDPGRFPDYSPALRDAMYDETVTFVHDVVKNDRSVLNLLDADYTFLNEPLARHYGIDGVTGTQMRRVSLKDGRRGGVLTQASVLTVTSYPRRTSPVLRGKWVLEEILGTPPPPPPPVVGTLSQDDAPKEGLTFRQRLEKHREKPECAGCHARLDPLGFGLENFDAVGRWREAIENAPVDARGEMPSGETFTGPQELKRYLLRARKDTFVRNLSERMLSYALGRGLEPHDLPAVRKIASRVEKNGYRGTTLVEEIVSSYPFQYRKNL